MTMPMNNDRVVSRRVSAFRPLGLTAVTVSAMLVAVPLASAATLLINPASSGSTGIGRVVGSAPYSGTNSSTTTGSYWNSGIANDYGVPVWSNNATATDVTIRLDGMNASGGFDFTSPTATGAGNAALTGVFSPSLNANGVWATAVDHDANANTPNMSALGMRVTGLAAGEYDVYIVAAYTGTNTSSALPGGSSPLKQAVWGLSGGTNDSFTYNSGVLAAAPNDILENSTTASWVEGNNYTRLRVTLTAGSPTLYVFTTGDVAKVGGNISERRGWLGSVEIVSVPEPVAFSAIAVAGVGLLLRRRTSAVR